MFGSHALQAPIIGSCDALYSPGVYADVLYPLQFRGEEDGQVSMNDFCSPVYLPHGQYHGNRGMVAIGGSPNPRGAKICSARAFTHFNKNI